MNPLLPNEVSRTFLKSSDRNTVNRIKRHIFQTCRFKISEQYIKSAFNTFKRGFLYEEGGILLGFCIWKEKNAKDEIYKAKEYTPPDEKYMEILLLCTVKNDIRLGTRILEDIESYCLDSSITFVNLEPLDDATMLFYERVGYRLTSPPYQKKRIMTKYIESFKIQQHRSGTTRRVKRGTLPSNVVSANSSKFLSRKDFFSLSPEEARQMMNYNIDLTNVEARSP